MKNVQAKQRLIAGIAAVSILFSATAVGAFAAPGVTSLPDEFKNPGYVTVTNNVSIADTITFQGVMKGDTVKVYANKIEKQMDADGNVVIADGNEVTIDVLGDLIGSVVAKNAGSATVSIKDGIKSAKVWVSLTWEGKLESDKVLVDVKEEEITGIVDKIENGKNIAGVLPELTFEAPEDKNGILKKESADVTADYFVVENNAGLSDIFKILAPTIDKKLPIFPEKTAATIYTKKTIQEDGQPKDVYTALGKGTVKKDGTLVISLKDGILPADGGSIYVGISRYDAASGDTKHESLEKIKLTVDAEKTSANLTAEIKVTNNVGKPEEVTVIGSDESGKILLEADGITPKILAKDVIRVYKKGEKAEDDDILLGTATAKKDGDNLVIKLKEDLAKDVEIYVNRTGYGKKPSAYSGPYIVGNSSETDISYITSTGPAEYFVVQNNVGADYVQVGDATKTIQRIPEKTVVTIYAKSVAAEADDRVLGKGTVKKDGTVSIKLTEDLDEKTGGNLYITLKGDNAKENENRMEVSYEAVDASTTPDEIKIEVTKNANKPKTDEIKVAISNLKAKDIVEIYKEEPKENVKSIGKASAKKDGETLIIKLNDVVNTGETIWVSVVTSGKLPSKKQVTVVADDIKGPNTTNMVGVEYFEVINNAPPVADILNVKKMLTPIPEKTTVTVYDIAVNNAEDLKTAVQLGKGAIKQGAVSITLNTDLTELDKQRVDSAKGKIYVVLQGDNATPSSAIAVTISPENTANGGLPNAKFINNVSIPDEVIVEYLDAKDLITVYKAETKKAADGTDELDGSEQKIYKKAATVLAAATAKKPGDSVVIKLKEQLSKGDAVAVTLTKYGEPEGLAEDQIRILVVEDEETSASVIAKNVKIYNNAGIADEIEIKGVPDKAVVNIYESTTVSYPIATGIAKKDGTVLIKLKDALPLVASNEEPPKLYLSLIEFNKKETRKENWTAAVVPPENTAVKGLKFIITNNVSIPDTVEVKDLKARDLIKVYGNKVATIIDENGNRAPDQDVPGDILGTATAKNDGESVVIKLKDQLNEGDKIWLSLTRYGHPESIIDAPEVLKAVGITNNIAKLSNDSVEIKNYVDMTDTITIKGLDDKDLVIVYSAEVARIEIGRGVAKKDGSVIISIKEGLQANGGNVYLSLTEDNKAEGARIAFTVPAEGTSMDLSAGNIEVINNTTKSDEVHVIGLADKDVIKVYETESKAKLLGTATAKKDGSVIIKLKAHLESNSIYVTLTEYGLAESGFVEVAVPEEGVSERIIRPNDVEVYNNVNSGGATDRVEISNLEPKDKVLVYDAEKGGKKLGEGTASKDGIAIITIKELPRVINDGDESIYLELIEDNKKSVGRVAISIPAEKMSEALSLTLKVNNNVDKNPTVEVTGPLSEKDTVRIYEVKADDKREFLGEGKVKKINEILTITLNNAAKKSFDDIGELGAEAKAVEIIATLTNYGKKEVDASGKVSVTGQMRTKSIEKPDQVSIVNNDKKADTIAIYQLDEKDFVTVHDREGKEIGKGTANKEGRVTISIKELPFDLNDQAKNKVYIKRKAVNMLPSIGFEVEVPKVGQTLLPGQTAKPFAGIFAVNKPKSSGEGAVYVEIMKDLPEQAVVKAYVTSNSALPLKDEGISNGILKFTGHSGSSIWLSVTDEAKGMRESDRVKVSVKTDDKSAQDFGKAEAKQAKSQASTQKSTTSSSSSKQTTTTTTKLKKSTKLTSKYVSSLSGGDIYINGLTPSAIITAYDKSDRFLTDAVAGRGGEAWIYIGSNHYEKYVWLTVTEVDKAESSSLKVTLK